jgi:hypothetical protein
MLVNHDPTTLRRRCENRRTKSQWMWVAVERFIAYLEAATSCALCSAVGEFGCLKTVFKPCLLP